MMSVYSEADRLSELHVYILLKDVDPSRFHGTSNASATARIGTCWESIPCNRPEIGPDALRFFRYSTCIYVHL